MGDTNTAEAVALKLKEKEEEVAKLKEAIDKEKGRVENAEKKFSQWSNELGDIRKERETLQTTLADAQKTIEELNKAVAAHSVTPVADADNSKDKKPAETPEDVERELTEEQKKVGDKAFQKLSDEEKIRYIKDPKFKVAFLRRLQNDAPLIPQSPWATVKEAEQKVKSGVDDVLDRVFAKKNRASFTPEGPRSGITIPTGETEKPEFIEDDRVH